ncbi:MAG: glycoside hydrolase [Williamsia sp.]|nr:glycoside hydrolase [Williamsia sp.]
MKKSFAIGAWVILGCNASMSAQELITYPPPQGVIYSQHNDDYTVKVRKPGGIWQDLFEYKVKVDMDKPQDASMVYFDFSGSVEVAIRKNNGDAHAIKVRPGIADKDVVLKGNTAFFALKKPAKLSVEFDGDKLHNLHVFGNPLEKDRPGPGDTDVIYFGPGIHTPKDTLDGSFLIPSGKTVYIAGGAIVRGKLVCDGVSNVCIRGRGILDQPQRGIEIKHSKNITIDGIIVVNPKHYTVYGGGSEGISIRNLKSFSANGWSDGLDFMSCSNVTIDDIFMRNSDDCIAIYGHRWDFYGDARNYKVTNAILWADIAHPINIGIHGNTQKGGEVIEDLLFKNIDILEQDEDDPDYQGCMAITAGDLNLVRHVSFEDIRVDDFQEGQLFNLRVVYNAKYNTGPGRGIEGVTFKNISYTGINLNPSVIKGYDQTHGVKDIRFIGFKINGQDVTNQVANKYMVVGPFVDGVIVENKHIVSTQSVPTSGPVTGR